MLEVRDIDFKFYIENGYLKKDLFIRDKEFLNIADDLKLKLEEYLEKNLDNIRSLGGFKSGNLNFISNKHSDQIINLLNQNNFKNFFNFIIQDDINNYEIMYGGNLNFPKSKKQFFHTDGKWNPRMIIINIATTEITNNNGPMEIIEGSHKFNYAYWKFILKNFFSRKKKVFLKKGEIMIREHRLWHRGTLNNSKNIREMMGIMLIEKTINKNQIINEKKNDLSIFSNIFGISKKEKIKEFLFINLKFIFFIYKFIISMVK
tara:strand:- start:149 stop:931 length:783 start_codon:yes stop_codon:yes gene_type:complete